MRIPSNHCPRTLGRYNVYIKARTPQLNGKVERSHRTDKQEFYQLLSYTGDVDLNQKLYLRVSSEGGSLRIQEQCSRDIVGLKRGLIGGAKEYRILDARRHCGTRHI